MYFTFFRHWLVALTVLALAGCAGPPIVQSAPATVALGSIDHVPVEVSKCEIPHSWYFRGACVKFYVPYMATGRVRLGSKGLNTEVDLPRSISRPMTPLKLGLGTNLSNITGTNGGKIFPLFGSIPCRNLIGETVTCPVAVGFLYLIIINDTTRLDVRFFWTPEVTVRSATGFPGKTCSSASLENFGSTLAYVLLPTTAKLVGDTAKFPPFGTGVIISPAKFVVFGFFCS
jgi:hypothetical protein